MPSSENDSSALDEKIVFARNLIQKELDFRLEKLWKIFSWSTTVLISIIAATVAMKTNKTEIAPRYQTIFSAATLLLSVYSVTWLILNLRLESMARRILVKLDLKLGVYGDEEKRFTSVLRPDRKKMFNVVGFPAIVGLLGLAAILAIWI